MKLWFFVPIKNISESFFLKQFTKLHFKKKSCSVRPHNIWILRVFKLYAIKTNFGTLRTFCWCVSFYPLKIQMTFKVKAMFSHLALRACRQHHYFNVYIEPPRHFSRKNVYLVSKNWRSLKAFHALFFSLV